MMRSLFSGISGLKAHQIDLDVIANNIANVNTIGFKKSRVSFSTVYVQEIKSGMAPRGTMGGTNPQGVGLGVQVGSIDTIFTKGGIEKTDISSDLAIDGAGFFVLSDGNHQYYTRAGNFDTDGDGYLIQKTTGLRVMGWLSNLFEDETASGEIDYTKGLQQINMKVLEKLPAKETTYVEYRSNLDARWKERNFPTEVQYKFKDAEGREHDAIIKFVKDNVDPLLWRIYLIVDGKPIHFPVPPTIRVDWDGTVISGQQTISFDPDGDEGQPAKAILDEGNTAGFNSVTPLADLYHKWIIIGANSNEFRKVEDSNDPPAIAGLNDDIVYSDPNTSSDTNDQQNANGLEDNDRVYGEVKLRIGNEIKTFTLKDTSSGGNDYVTLNAGDTPQDILNYMTGNGTTYNFVSDDGAVLSDYMNFEYVNGQFLLTVKPDLANVQIEEVNFKVTDSSGNNVKTGNTPFDSSFNDGDPAGVLAQREFLDGAHNITVSENPAQPAKIKGRYIRAGTNGDIINNDPNRISAQPWYLTEDTKLIDVGVTDRSSPLKLTVRGVGEYTFEINPSNDETIGDLLNDINFQTGGMINAYLDNGQIVLETSYTGADISLTVSGDLSTNSVYRELFTTVEAAKIYSSDSLANVTSTTTLADLGINTIDGKIHVTVDGTTYDFDLSNLSGITTSSTIADLQNALYDLKDNGNTLYFKDIANFYIENGKIVVTTKDGTNSAQLQVEGVATGGDDIIEKIFTDGASGLYPSSPETGSGDKDDWDSLIASGKDRTFSITDKFSGTINTYGNSQEVEETITLDNVPENAKTITIGSANVGWVKVDIDQLKSGNATVRTVAPINITEPVKMTISPTGDGKGVNFKIVDNGSAEITTVGLIEGQSHLTNITVYDRQGGEHNLSVTFEKLGNNYWVYKAKFADNDDLNNYLVNQHGYLVFDEYGRIDVDKTRQINNTSEPYIVPPVKIKYPDGTIQTIDLDMAGVTQFKANTTTSPRSQNGYGMGMMTGYEIDEQGIITGIYDNGIRKDIAQIALANFRNPGGLQSLGNTLFSVGANSGLPQIGTANTGGRGKIMGGSLEMSNVDLSEEFSNMIIAQRGYQANSRVITTADRILEELVNMKR